jgi:PAS domain S-box-containing protein
VQESSQPVLHAANLPATGEPGLLLGAPIYDAEGRFAGVVIESLKAVHLADLLAPAELDPADRVYLVDDQGRLVARRDAEQGEMLPSVVALLSGDEPSGAMSYGTSHHQHLVGYAQVSGTDWDVVVERPATIALASSVASRNVAFFILLAAITAAISIGTLAAGGLTATLAALVRAVNQFEAGWADTPLPRSTISEVARLSAAFGALRDRLNTRTAERDQAEIALRMSEERYRTIVETAQEGIWLVNMDSETTFVNRAMAAMLGFSVDEMPGLPLSAFLDEASLHTLLDPGKGQQHITEQHEVSLRRKDGTLVWALMLTNPLRDKEGHPAGMLITVIDITHRRLAEQALRESEARFRNMADSAPVLIWIGEMNGTGTFFNQRWSDFTGRTLEQSLGFGWMDSVHPDDIAHCMEVYRAAIAQQEPFHLEYRLRRADGQYRWFINSGVPRQTHDGLSAGYIGSCVDITERKRAEDVLRFLSEASAALSASLDYTTTLSSVARLMVPMLADWCIIDILQEDGSIEQVSVAHVDPEKEDLIRELRRKYPPDPNEPHVIWRVLQTGIAEMAVGRDEEHLARTTCNEEHFQLRCSLGEIGYMTVPLLARGRTLGVVSFVAGQSGRCYQPEDLALAEEIAYRAALAVDNARLYHEAQAAVQARDQFLSIASHELKTPLTALMGYVTLLQRRFVPEGSLSSRDLRALRVIGEQATRLNRLITLLLDLSRIQKGQLGIEPAPLDLVHLTQRVAADMELTLEQHTLTVCAPDEPLWLMGDEVRLEQVLQNLLQNAIKYSPEGGLIEVGVARHGTLARMWVTDEGVGIPKAAMAQLFQRFQRIANPATQHVSGLGLGLYIVKEIVTLHGGEIEVTSTEGLGSTFTVYLPLQVETHTSIAASREA